MITFNDEKLYKAVDEYRFEHRFRSQNEALMALINKGIEVLMGETPADNIPSEKLTDEDRCVLRTYHDAEPVYQEIALELLANHKAMREKSRA